MERCIDISNYQGVVSVQTFLNMRANGIPNVIIRCSYTQGARFVQRVDASFAKNIINAYKANLRIGVYHFSQAISETEAIKEAEFTLKTIEPYKKYIHLPVAFDWEFYKRLNSSVARKMGKQRCKQICDAYCRTVRNSGYESMVYANLSTLNGYIADELYKKCKIWVAEYNSKCHYKHEKYMWQYSSKGRVPGISGNIDMDYIYKDEPKPEPQPYHGKFPELPRRGWFSSGDTGENVKRLQRFLNWYGDYGLAVDGEVGRKTINAVRDYQRNENHGLAVDGAFGTESLKRAKLVRR